MKSSTLRSVFIFLVVLMALNFPANAQLDTLMHNGKERYYLLKIPSGYSGEKTPMIIAMHGGLGSAMNLQDQSQLSVKCDDAGYIVVYPEGVKSPLGIRTWNAGVCCGYAAQNNIDDVGFISKLIDEIKTKVNIDTTRVYATGMSNGGFMSYRLACELSDKIAAIAPVAASMTVSNCVPKRPVPTIHFHSKKDESILYQGGVGNGLSKHYNPPLDSIFHAFSQHFKCKDSASRVVAGKFGHTKWSTCSCNAAIDYYLTEDGGHSWPGGKKTVIGDDVSMFVDASGLMIEFFNHHSLACSTGSIKPVSKKTFTVFPNPSMGLVQIVGEVPINSEVLVQNAVGQIVLRTNLSSNKQIDLSQLDKGLYLLQIDVQKKRVLLIE